MSQIIDDVELFDDARRQEEENINFALQRSLQDQIRASSSRRAPNGRSSSSADRDLDDLDREIDDVKAQMSRLEALLNELCKEREEKLSEIRNAQVRPDAKGKGKAGKIDYNSEFEWSGALHDKLQSVFGFDSFRLCQEGICNASMDNRDIVAIMPTGGGKSLGYQLPALLVPGCTLVISPLLALISDQIMHLQEAGVDAVMLTGTTSREQSDLIYRRLQAMASGASNSPEIKLCYVTPEKIASSKKFLSALEKLHRVNKLARFVIDEAHCVSLQGHDFRPDYQKLSTLRQMFPTVPILALSATCPAAVLADLMSTLRLPALTMGSAATPDGTVLFSTSLYRKNLHYHVLPKPSGSNDSIKAMMNYILENHPRDTGIIYCLSRKDAESVAESLATMSDGKIKTGVYHAEIPDGRKEALHRQWREGKVKVVCATIAFGLGIDKGDVRFVIHHSLSKSLDGFYQESGRAGRDGKDADCVLYYRPQDATRIASLVYSERGGQGKVLAMLAFVSDVHECRKIQFANYFNKSSKLSLSSWATAEEDTHTRCGHCDNCTRPPDALESLGVRGRVAAWQLLRVAEAAGKEVTMAQLCDLARGLGGGAGNAEGSGGKKGRGRTKEKASVDVSEVAGGKVELSKEQTETLCVQLLVDGYLEPWYSSNKYAINVYLKPTGRAARFTRLSRRDIEQGKGPSFDCAFVKKAAKSAKPRKSAAAAGSSARPEKAQGKAKAEKSAKPAKAGTKRKRDERGEDLGGEITSMSEDEDEATYRREMGGFIVSTDEEDEFDDISESDMEWQTTMRGGTRWRASAGKDKGKDKDVPQPPVKRPRQSLASRTPAASSSSRTSPDKEVIEISDSDD